MNRLLIAAAAVAAFALVACGGGDATAEDSRDDAVTGTTGASATAETAAASESTVLAPSTPRPRTTTAPANTPAPTPVRTASAAGPFCPDGEKAICIFAGQVEGWLQAGDIAAILGFGKPTTYDCPGPVAGGLGGPYPLCDGAAKGEKREGYPLWVHGSEDVVYDPAAFSSAVDQRTTNTVELAAVGCAANGSPTGSCKEKFVLVFETAPGQVVYLAYDRSPETGQPRLLGAGFAGDIADVLLNGGEARVGDNSYGTVTINVT